MTAEGWTGELSVVLIAEPKLTAAQVILLAADDLTTAGQIEFSEWDLTVATWSRDRFRFGLRGYAQTYPDHKRVMMEIMGQKPANPIVLKYMEKIRPNTYRLTPLGRSTAARLRSGVMPKNEKEKEIKPTPVGSKPISVREIYDTVSTYLGRQEFRRWQDNPAEPKDWASAAAFIGITRNDEENPIEKLDAIRSSVKAALEWCTVQEAVYLTRGAGQGGSPIHVRDLSEMLDFTQALVYRFPEHLARS